jgi:hypothetical protein
MKRFVGLDVVGFVGIGACVVLAASVCPAVEPKKPNSPSQPSAPAPAASPAPSSGPRYYNPPSNNGAYVPNRAAPARSTPVVPSAPAITPPFNNGSGSSSNGTNSRPAGSYPYGFGTGYGYYYPFGYTPNNFSAYYYPPGTVPYVLGYNPYTGATTFYPYAGSSAYYRNPYLGYGYPGAVFVDPGQLYGIGPIQQLMGVGNWAQPQANFIGPANGNPNQFANRIGNNGNGNAANGNIVANAGLANNTGGGPNGAGIGDLIPAAPKPALVGGGKATELAWKFISYGDAHFKNQKYSEALDRYRSAVHEYPKLGDAWFRQGFALAALGKYEPSAKALRRGLELKPDWVDSTFRLSDLYGDAATDRQLMLDKMTKASDADPTNTDLAYVSGVHLFADGKVDQAAPYFRRVAQLAGTDVEVKPFLANGQ